VAGLKLVVTISGLHGTGKSTYARRIAHEFGLRHASAGELFRQICSERGITVEALTREAGERSDLDRLIDDRTKAEARKRSVVIDGLLAGWMVGDLADIKIYLRAPDRIRIERVARRDRLPFEEARRATLSREDAERRRFRRFYSIGLDDLSIYDLMLNTNLLPLESNLDVIKQFIQAYADRKRAGYQNF
jgi:cytidylate kinase